MFSNVWEPNNGKKPNTFCLKLTHDPLITNIPFQSHFSFLYIPCLQCPSNLLANTYLSFRFHLKSHSQSPSYLKIISPLNFIVCSTFLYFIEVTFTLYLYYRNMTYHPLKNELLKGRVNLQGLVPDLV